MGKFSISFFKKFYSCNYLGVNNKYDEYFSITDDELIELLSIFKLKNEMNKFKNILSLKNTTIKDDNDEINIILSSSLSNYNNNTHDNNNVFNIMKNEIENILSLEESEDNFLLVKKKTF